MEKDSAIKRDLSRVLDIMHSALAKIAAAPVLEINSSKATWMKGIANAALIQYRAILINAKAEAAIREKESIDATPV